MLAENRGRSSCNSCVRNLMITGVLTEQTRTRAHLVLHFCGSFGANFFFFFYKQPSDRERNLEKRKDKQVYMVRN